MRPERRTQAEFDGRMPSAELVAGRRQVAAKVHALREEIRDEKNAICATLYTALGASANIWVDQFEKARFNDRMSTR
jgi:hypothetical protein